MTVPSTEDVLDLGDEPRPPMRASTRHRIVAVLAVLAAAAVVVVLLVRPGDDGASRPTAVTPAPVSSGAFAAGPVLVSVDGHDALQAPGLPGLGASVEPVTLDSAPDLVQVVGAALPGFRDVRGGRTPVDSSRFGAYLAGTYDAAGGGTTSVSLYTVSAPGTTHGTDQFVSRSQVGNSYRVRTDVSVFTGNGWWVHIVSLGPDDPATAKTGDVDRLLPLAENPALVATT